MMRVAEGHRGMKCLKFLLRTIKGAVIFNSYRCGTASPGAFGNMGDIFGCHKAWGSGGCFGI